MLLGVAASADEPIAGGRHKVFGRAELAIVPQTSTIASHLPRALGVALGIGRAAKLGVACPWPRDAVAMASFGDASASHSTAVGAINAACHTAYQGIPVPLLLVCEDNGLGISVPTPPGWVAASFAARPGLLYLAADGCDPVATYDAAARAAGLVRSRRRPAFLHLSVVRFLGHAGSDAEAAYRAPADLAADLARDPLVADRGRPSRLRPADPDRGGGPLRRGRRAGPRRSRAGPIQSAAGHCRGGHGPAGAAPSGAGGRARHRRPGPRGGRRAARSPWPRRST